MLPTSSRTLSPSRENNASEETGHEISFKMADEEDADGLIEDNPINVIGRILEAVQFAAIKHKDQRRKDPEETPYINHPIGVAYILWKEGGIHDSRVLQVSLRPNRQLDMILCKVSY